MPLTRTSQVVTVGDVYGDRNIEASLAGRQEYVDFRFVQDGDRFLTLDGRVIQHNPASHHQFGGPRLIVDERRLRKFIYTETGDVRSLNRDEYALDTNGNVFQADGPVTESYPILTREVQEVQ